MLISWNVVRSGDQLAHCLEAEMLIISVRDRLDLSVCIVTSVEHILQVIQEM